jgi:hypothetical protein
VLNTENKGIELHSLTIVDATKIVLPKQRTKIFHEFAMACMYSLGKHSAVPVRRNNTSVNDMHDLSKENSKRCIQI